MRITKFGHACVRIEYDGHVVVVDPGAFTEQDAVHGAETVLITHEHRDHYHPDHLRASDATIMTIEAVAAQLREDAPDLVERLVVVSPGEALDVGFPARVVGERHAVIHPELPRFDNSGYLFELGGVTLYHPGDALTAPGEPVDILCAPVSAPWLKVSEAIDFIREVGAPRNLAIHDAIYSELGLLVVDGHMKLLNEPLGYGYTRLAAGQDLEL